MKRKTTVVPASAVPVFYTNSVGMSQTTFDVRLRLSQVQSVSKTQLSQTDVAYVYMSHEHFREFAKLVNRGLLSLDRGLPEAP